MAMAVDVYLVLVIIGVLGIFAMSFAFPLLAICLQAIFRASKQSSKTSTFNQSSETISLAVLIPAHNEALTLAATLNSIKSANTFATDKNVQLQIFVAADGCTDQTAKIALEHGAIVIEQKDNLGKWQTLERLLKYSHNSFNQYNFDWVAIVDAGSIWPENFISKISDNLRDNSLIGIAPGYYNSEARLPEKISWLIEKLLKSFENFAGGPISVHGATVLYRSSALQKAFKYLSGANWTNDDVVIPLVIRSLENNSSILYRQDIKILDQAISDYQQEKIRRKRLVKGNLQWISSLWCKIFLINPITTCLALRRISRVLWAYWLIALAVGAFCFIASKNWELFSIMLVACTILSLPIVNRAKQIRVIIMASLLSPVYFLFFARKESSWK